MLSRFPWRRSWPWIVAGALGGLAGLEIALRLAGFGDPPLARQDPEIEYLVRAGQSCRRFGNRIEINAHHMRGEPIAPKKSRDEFRVLLVGDSIVYGGHRLDQTETIATALGRNLRKRLPGQTVAVLPAAASSWGPANMAAFLERFGTFESDAIIVVLSSHDYYDHPIFAGVRPYREHRPLGAIHDAILAVGGRYFRRPPQPQDRRGHTGPDVTRLLDLVRSTGQPAWLLLHSTRPEWEGREEAPEFRAMEALARERGIAVQWTRNAFPDGALAVAFYDDIIHLNARGNTRIAAYLDKLLGSETQERSPPL